MTQVFMLAYQSRNMWHGSCGHKLCRHVSNTLCRLLFCILNHQAGKKRRKTAAKQRKKLYPQVQSFHALFCIDKFKSMRYIFIYEKSFHSYISLLHWNVLSRYFLTELRFSHKTSLISPQRYNACCILALACDKLCMYYSKIYSYV